MSYAKMISEMRRLGLTQAEIAIGIGRSQSVVSDIERGKALEIRASTGQAISVLFDRVSAPKPAKLARTDRRKTDRRQADRRVADRRTP